MIINTPVTAPTTRVDGRPLATSEIAYIEMQVSTDGGQTYSVCGQVANDGGVFQYETSDFGTFLFKATAVDNQVPRHVSPDSNVVSATIAPPELAAPNAPVLGIPATG